MEENPPMRKTAFVVAGVALVASPLPLQADGAAGGVVEVDYKNDDVVIATASK
jgi:hypothetical protein